MPFELEELFSSITRDYVPTASSIFKQDFKAKSARLGNFIFNDLFTFDIWINKVILEKKILNVIYFDLNDTILEYEKNWNEPRMVVKGSVECIGTSSLNFCILRILEIEIITNYNSKKGWTSLYKSPIDPHNQLKQPLFTRFTIGPQRKDLLYKLQKKHRFLLSIKTI